MSVMFFDLQRFASYRNYTTYSLVSGSAYADTVYNYAGGVKIYGYGGNDYIYNSTNSNYTVNGSYGYVTIDGGYGNDTIKSFDPLVSISGGAGNDLISVYSGNYNGVITVNGGTDNDTIYGDSATAGSGVLYQYAYGDGSDVIYNVGSKDSISISGTSTWSTTRSGNDILLNVGGYISTLVGAYGNAPKIYPTLSPVIRNYTTYSLVGGSAYADTVYNYAGGVKIYGYGGNDYIYNSTNSNYTVNGYGYVTIDGGEGSDTIYSNDPYVSIAGGSGNDSISLGSWSGISVNGGTGNDTIETYSGRSNGILYQFKSGDGYDVIKNWSSNDTLNLGGAYYTLSTVGENVVVSLTSGTGSAITLTGAKDKTINITGGTLESATRGKYITNYNKNSVLSGSAYADTVYNYAGGVKIYGYGGNDYIFNSTNSYYTINGGYGYVTIDGGEGSDTIKSYDPRVSLSGGAGADVISLYSSGFSSVTINGGTGNDIIYGDSLGGGVLYQYKSGDGSDIIYGYDSKDSITLTGGNSWKTVTSGNNILVSVAGSGVTTLVGANGKTINVYPTSTTPDPAPTPTPTTTVSAQEVIKKFMKSLDTTNDAGVVALNQAVKTATGGYFQNINVAIDQMLLDCQSYNNADSRNGWRTFLKEKCGIDLDNDDTGAITGFDAGGSSTQKGASDIVPESGALSDSTDNSFTTGGLTVKLGYIPYDGRYVYAPSAISYSSLSNSRKKYIWQAFRTWWASGALNLIADSYGSNYGFTSNSSATTMYFGFFDEQPAADTSVTLALTSKPGNVLAMAVNFNSNVYGNLTNGGNPNGQNVSGYTYLDRTLAHEMTHAVMMANINHFSELPQFIKEGVAELTQGADNRRTSIEHLAKNVNDLRLSLALDDYGTGTIGNVDMYAGGYMFMRYLAKQGSEHYPASSTSSSSLYSLQSKSLDVGSANSSAVSVKGIVLTLTKDFSDDMLDLSDYSSAVKKVDATKVSQDIMIFGNRNANSIAASEGNDTIFANIGNDTLRGGKGKDVLFGEAGNDKIYGGDGDDIINGGTGNDTLSGGNGKDIFIFGNDFGKDVITDYTAGKDKIKFTTENTSITSSAVTGKNVILTVGNAGTITVKNAKGKKITVVDSSGKSTSSVYGGLALTNSSSAKTTLSSKEKTADASTRTKKIKITGNSKANTIAGGSGNDSIYGGSGNDSLVGNDGNDKLYGESGNDILRGGSGNDSLKGGTGNDSLWGDAGKDTFIYSSGDGKDVIYGFGNDDLLKITGTFSASYSKSTGEVYFKVGTTSKAITLSDFSASSFHVNNSTYHINSKDKFVKK